MGLNLRDQANKLRESSRRLHSGVLREESVDRGEHGLRKRFDVWVCNIGWDEVAKR